VHIDLGNQQALVINNTRVDALKRDNFTLPRFIKQSLNAEVAKNDLNLSDGTVFTPDLSTKNSSYSDSGLHEAANQEPAPEFAGSSTVYDVYL
jgi:hypothetical protein